VLLSAMRRAAAEALWRAGGFASLYVHALAKHQTLNAELCRTFCIRRSAMGDASFLRLSDWRDGLGEPLLRCDVRGTRAPECFRGWAFFF
jgi:hypothetical protein